MENGPQKPSKGAQILEMDIKKVVELLNKAFADEWLAYYQYWVGAQVVKGPMRSAVVAELLEHAQDELRHAQMLSDRIIHLGGTPILEPKEWYTLTNCGYAVPSNEHVKAILAQNVEGEQCAIDVYSNILSLTKDKDLLTYNMSLEILGDEVEHESDLQALLEDIALIK